ncbi:MAG: accessory gene regulator B family protein [Defluviitaleaceae bacterium]|nr:accessory gene regulator B family protein [Defluviitaleaceae bacterium]
MKPNLTRRVALILAEKLNFYTKKEGLAFTKMELGMEVFLVNISKIIIMYLLATLIGVLWQTIAIHFAFALIKRYSFGAHALNSMVCTAICCFAFVIIPWLLLDIGINNFGVVAVFTTVIFILYLYAPADTKAKPLVGKGLRLQLKNKALICGFALMLVALLVPSQSLKLLLALGAIFQCVAILPITYKILKRSERNYEKYEKA